MPDLFPSKLPVPIDDENRFEFTIQQDDTTETFEQKVLQNCPQLKTFKF